MSTFVGQRLSKGQCLKSKVAEVSKACIRTYELSLLFF